MHRVLVLCTANRCRSPLVGALLTQIVREAGLDEELEIVTGGLFAEPDHPADDEVVSLLAARGIDATNHRSRPVSEAELLRADLILVMEEAHRQAIFRRAPRALARTLLLSELAQRHDDIPDAHGQERAVYEELVALVEGLLQDGWPRLCARLRV